MRNPRGFSKITKQLIFGRAKGHCEECSAKLFPGKFEYDHVIPYEFGGDSSFNNCKLLCINCHDAKTYKKDIPDVAKSNRLRAKEMNIKRKKRSWGYGKNDRYRKKLNGAVVLR